MHPVLLAAYFAASGVSYSRDVAPILAFHCHYCHGNRRQVPAGGFDTRDYAGLMRGGSLGPEITPRDPASSLLVQFIEGARGPDHRMPLGAGPLDPRDISTIRRWIAEGAAEDRDTGPRYTVTSKPVRVRAGRPLEIRCRVPVRAYVTVRLVGDSRTLLQEEGTVQNPKGPRDAAAPGEWIRWTVQPEQYWPQSITVRLEIAYADAAAARAQLRVKRRR